MYAGWGSIGIIGVVMAAEVMTVTPVAVAPRSLESLPAFAWWMLIGWSFAGWVSASLKPAVIAMHDTSQHRSVAVAGFVSTLVSSMSFGIGLGLYLLTLATWDEKPLPALYGYLGSLIGGFWGVKGLEFAVEMVKEGMAQWRRGRVNDSGGSAP